MMDQNKQPGINFKGIILADERFTRLPIVSDSCELFIDMEHNWNGEGSDYVSEIKTNVKLMDVQNDAESFVLEFTMMGLFSVNREDPNLNIEDYIREFSSTLMFPYIREHISSVSIKAGIRPILLPPTNIRALISNTDKKSESEKSV